jgi:hypothetical protein
MGQDSHSSPLLSARLGWKESPPSDAGLRDILSRGNIHDLYLSQCAGIEGGFVDALAPHVTMLACQNIPSAAWISRLPPHLMSLWLPAGAPLEAFPPAEQMGALRRLSLYAPTTLAPVPPGVTDLFLRVVKQNQLPALLATLPETSRIRCASAEALSVTHLTKEGVDMVHIKLSETRS